MKKKTKALMGGATLLIAVALFNISAGIEKKSAINLASITSLATANAESASNPTAAQVIITYHSSIYIVPGQCYQTEHTYKVTTIYYSDGSTTDGSELIDTYIHNNCD